MSSQKLRILSVASEISPFSMSGGLAQITRSLPLALHDLGHKVSIITPLYRHIDKKKYRLQPLFQNVPLKIDDESQTNIHYWQGSLEGKIPVYFVEHSRSFSHYKRLYGSKYDNERFWIFNLAAIKLPLLLKKAPHLIHCHDWQTGLLPYFLNTRFKKYTLFKKTATLFTIHNLVFQLGENWWEVPPERKDDGRRALPNHRDHERVRAINFAKRAIINATLVNAVSEQYAKEILTKNFGENLHHILKHKANDERLFGIVNGIDEEEYNPATDPGLYRNYSIDNLEDKLYNKIRLQRLHQLPQNKNIPLIGMVTRLTEQKGIDLLMDILPYLMKLDLQLVIFGGGHKIYEREFRSLHKKYPKKIGIQLKFQQKDSTKVFAGSDMFLVPSRFEPCGITQLESMRYGSIPIVREVGGLVDTVTDYNPRTHHGNGFVFSSYNPLDLLTAIVRALESYKHVEGWGALVRRAMQRSHSWEIPAQKYLLLYRKALRQHKQDFSS